MQKINFLMDEFFNSSIEIMDSGHQFKAITSTHTLRELPLYFSPEITSTLLTIPNTKFFWGSPFSHITFSLLFPYMKIITRTRDWFKWAKITTNTALRFKHTPGLLDKETWISVSDALPILGPDGRSRKVRVRFEDGDENHICYLYGIFWTTHSGFYAEAPGCRITHYLDIEIPNELNKKS